MPAFSSIDWSDSPLQLPIAIYQVDFATDLTWRWNNLKGYKDQVEYRPKYVCVDNLDSNQFISVYFDNVRYPVNQFQRLTLPIPIGALTCRLEGDPASLLTCEVIFSVEDIGAADTINFKAIQDSGEGGTMQPIRLHAGSFSPSAADVFGIDLFLIGAAAAYGLPDPATVNNGYSVQCWNDPLSIGTVTATSFGGATIDGVASLGILPGDKIWFVSDGSNWRSETATVWNAAGNNQPSFVVRNTNNPGVVQGIGRWNFYARSDAGVERNMCVVDVTLASAVDGAETSQFRVFSKVSGGPLNTINSFRVQDGVAIGNPTTGFPGSGGANAARPYEVNGNGVAGPRIIARDRQASGVSGGSSGAAGAFNTVRLNELPLNDLSAGLAGNQITNVPPGRYIARWWCMAYNVDNFSTYIYNVTAGAQITTGINGDAPAGANGLSIGNEDFILAATSTLELRRRVAVANLVDGGGQAVAFGISQIFALVQLEQVQS